MTARIAFTSPLNTTCAPRLNRATRSATRHPSLGAWAQRYLGPSHWTLPSSVCINQSAGREPKWTGNGRCHYPIAFSTILAGAGAKRGYVHGTSDAKGAHIADKPVTVFREISRNALASGSTGASALRLIEHMQTSTPRITLKINFILAALIVFSCGHAHADSNSKGKDSPVVVGTRVSISEDGKTLTVKQGRDIERTLKLEGKGKINYVGITDEKARKPTPGYGVKAKVSQDNVIKSIQLTEPLTAPAPLGPDRFQMTAAQVHAAADKDHDGRLSYVEFSASISRSEKHGPDKFAKHDRNDDGSLDVAELTALLPKVPWWKFSRKPVADWFKATDEDGNGKISVKEFEALATGKNHVEAHFQRADKNKDGSLDATETTTYLKCILHSLNDDE